jgi:hypothetical protein
MHDIAVFALGLAAAWLVRLMLIEFGGGSHRSRHWSVEDGD